MPELMPRQYPAAERRLVVGGLGECLVRLAKVQGIVQFDHGAWDPKTSRLPEAIEHVQSVLEVLEDEVKPLLNLLEHWVRARQEDNNANE